MMGKIKDPKLHFFIVFKNIYHVYIIRSVYENITCGASLECFPIIFEQFLENLRFDEKKFFCPNDSYD
eukprot:UN03658